MTKAYVRGHIRILALAILLFTGSGSAGHLFVGEAAAASVSRVTVNGNQRVDDETIRAYLSIQPGRSFSAQDVDQSLKSLFETGLFSDVSIVQRGGALIVTVVENPIINKIVFEGNKKFKDEQLAGVVQSRERSVFTRSRIQSDVQRILELYRRSGRFRASVEPKVIELEQNRVNVVFEVTEGPKTDVARISFIGNKAFSDSKLRNVVDTRQTSILSFLRSGDSYDPDRLAADEQKIRRYYLERGYADFQVISSVADLDRERNTFFITFSMEEGDRYRFGAIDVDSVVPGVDPESLRRLAVAYEGEIYSSKRVEESLEAITIELASSGYAFAQVRPRIDRNFEEKTIGVTFVVDEGPRAYIERINILGNDRTVDYVIRREFDIAEGDAYNRVMIDRAERRLKNLGYFKSVRITTEPGSAPDRVVVNVNIVEQPTGELSFGAGYSTSEGIVGDISLTERNFLGRGYRVTAKIGGGDNSNTYEFGFTDPYFLGRRVSAGVDVFQRDFGDTDFRSYDLTETGGGLTFGFPITENVTIQVGNKLNNQDISVKGFTPGDLLINCPGGVSRAVCQAAGETFVSSVNYSVIYNSLDNNKAPRDGIYARFTQEFAGVGGDVSFLRTNAKASYYKELIPDPGIVGLLRVQAGHIQGMGGDDVRLQDAFYRGGETVRGFESSGIGPRDAVTGDALGGKIYLAGTAELQFPIPVLPPELGFAGAVFADAGTLYDTDISPVVIGAPINDNSSIRSSVGGSILWDSPLGPLRADFAYVLSKENYDQEQFFRFGGGTRF
jgi:outer membrane protein insertion porin family